MRDNLLWDTVGRRRFGEELRLAGLLEAVVQESCLVNSRADRDESIFVCQSTFFFSRYIPTIVGKGEHIPVVLQYGSDIRLPKRLGNSPSLILREGNTSVLSVHADLAVKVARI